MSQLTTSSTSDPQMSYVDSLLGAAVFDLNGLPREYFTTEESSDISWVQTIFQALGLRSLLISSLQLEGFHHTIIHGSDYCAVVVKQKSQYVALLVSQTKQKVVSDAFIQWVQDFEPNALKMNARFRVA